MTIPLPKSKDGFRPSELMAIMDYGDARAAEARREALEEAAKLCDGIRFVGYVPPENGCANEYFNDAAVECAHAIRALKGTT